MNYGTYSSYIGVYRLYNNRRGRGRYRGRVGALYPTPLHLVSLLRLAFERASAHAPCYEREPRLISQSKSKNSVVKCTPGEACTLGTDREAVLQEDVWVLDGRGREVRATHYRFWNVNQG